MPLSNTIDKAIADFEAQLEESQDLFIEDIEAIKD